MHTLRTVSGLVAFSVVILVGPGFVAAHGDAPSLEATVGKYIIDIGYDDLRAGRDMEFDIDLFTSNPITYADFASVDVRVTRSGALVVEGSVENDKVHVPVFTVNFPEAGGYDIDVRYLDEADALIVARTFHVEVPGSSYAFFSNITDTLRYVLAACLFLVSFGAGGYALWQHYGPKK